jgi:hypothetical protein
VSAAAITLEVATATQTIQFIGKGGRLLTEVPDASAAYRFDGSEGYVRAKVIESNGRIAWVQPAIVPQRSTAARLAELLGLL